LFTSTGELGRKRAKVAANTARVQKNIEGKEARARDVNYKRNE